MANKAPNTIKNLFMMIICKTKDLIRTTPPQTKQTSIYATNSVPTTRILCEYNLNSHFAQINSQFFASSQLSGKPMNFCVANILRIFAFEYRNYISFLYRSKIIWWTYTWLILDEMVFSDIEMLIAGFSMLLSWSPNTLWFQQHTVRFIYVFRLHGSTGIEMRINRRHTFWQILLPIFDDYY